MSDDEMHFVQAEHARQQASKDAACPVCGEAVGLAPERCPRCETPHHFDCWEFSGGCGVYGCEAKVVRRAPTPPALPGKLGLPHKRAGSYAGHLWAPPLATALVFVFEIFAVPLLYFGRPEGWVPLAGMVLAFLWIALTSEHFYLDFDRRKVSKAKALLGHDLWEWDVEELEAFETLALEDPPGRGGMILVGVYPHGLRRLELSPPLELGSEEAAAALDLVRRIQVSQAFPARIPARLTRALEAGPAHATVAADEAGRSAP